MGRKPVPGGTQVFRWAVYNLPSTYSQKMNRLSCKIFGNYYTPPMPKDVAESNIFGLQNDWKKVHTQSEAVILRQSKLPDDLNPEWTLKYYPPHPQIRSLMYTLRQFGLYRSVYLICCLFPLSFLCPFSCTRSFRDEHMDFVDEMKRLRILRGKRFRVLGGMTGKRAQLREGK